jgi:hypothetical protein
MPAGHPSYRRGHPFEPRFAEGALNTLGFAVSVPENGPGGSGGVVAASDEVRRLVATHFGRRALDWLDRRAQAALDPNAHASGGGTTVVSGYDRDGFREAQVTYRWGPWFTESLPAPAYHVASLVTASLPGLEPAFTTIRAARTSGSQSLTFRMSGPLPLAALRPLMDGIGLGHQHPSLMTAIAFVLGARYVLPPDSALLTIRPLPSGVEMRLDVDLEGVPDLPPDVAQLLALQLGERPRSLHALERWVAAFTADGEDTPGSLSVLSVTVRPDMAARIALHVRPTVLTDTPPVPGVMPDPALAGAR